MFKILDCTLRDGGYYTNWDFSEKFVKNYLESMRDLPITYIELGYCSPPMDGYLGEYYYLPNQLLLNYAKDQDFKDRFAVMINVKDFDDKAFENFINIPNPPYKVVRLVVDPANVETCFPYLKKLKSRGFITCLNLMYLSKLDKPDEVIGKLNQVPDDIDYLYLVDSFGSCFPDQVGSIFKKFKELTPFKLGFHGHDNISLAFANTLEAIKHGAELVDSTMLGMGRGAGNLKTELILLHYLREAKETKNLMMLNKTLSDMEELWEHHRWGANFAYMVSGIYSLPQKKVMSWLSKKRFDVSRIVNHLMNSMKKVGSKSIDGNGKLQIEKKSNVLLIGGGGSVRSHSYAINMYIEKYSPLVVLTSLKYADTIKSNDRLIVLPGDELHKIGRNTSHLLKTDKFIVSPDSPAINSSLIPESACIVTQSFLPKNHDPEFAELDLDSPLGLTFGVLKNFPDILINCVGFDGYDDINQITQELHEENQLIFTAFKEELGREIYSLTPTRYKLTAQSIYSKIG